MGETSASLHPYKSGEQAEESLNGKEHRFSPAAQRQTEHTGTCAMAEKGRTFIVAIEQENPAVHRAVRAKKSCDRKVARGPRRG
eukprot:scaffold229206_cov28-Prasinocladus_malaysianus.AAC.1